jgi:hypothetical protein
MLFQAIAANSPAQGFALARAAQLNIQVPAQRANRNYADPNIRNAAPLRTFFQMKSPPFGYRARRSHRVWVIAPKPGGQSRPTVVTWSWWCLCWLCRQGWNHHLCPPSHQHYHLPNRMR